MVSFNSLVITYESKVTYLVEKARRGLLQCIFLQQVITEVAKDIAFKD